MFIVASTQELESHGENNITEVCEKRIRLSERHGEGNRTVKKDKSIVEKNELLRELLAGSR